MSVEPKKERFHRAAGERIRALRKERGWTQLELAVRSGYSERVIRKAEACGTLSHGVLEVLAATFATAERHLAAQDLVFDPLAAARLFMECYDRHEREMLPHIRHLLADDVSFVFNADPERNPLSGTWAGPEGVQAYLDRFFGMFARVGTGVPTARYLADGDSVIVRLLETVRFGDVVAPPVWVHLHFTFRNGRIARLDDFCDTDTAARFLNEIGMAGPGRATEQPPERRTTT